MKASNVPRPGSVSVGARERSLVLAVIALLLLPAAVELLWGTHVSPSEEQGRLPPGTSPFPTFSAASHLMVVPVPPDTNVSTRLTLVSLQGLVNRERAQIYLDFAREVDENDSLLRFVLREYNLTHEVLDIDGALARYMPSFRGLVVYDPSRPESVNIATMVGAIEGAALAGPDTANALSRAHGLPILFEYATSEWRLLDPIRAYDRALEDLYPSCTDRLLSIYAPDWVRTRDYLIASRAFVFYHAQGALASPSEVQATARILHATPRGIPVLGWFHSPTLTEENAFVQIASREGKFIVGAQEVPNLSLLSALGRGAPWHQPRVGAGPVVLEDRTYAVVAIPDGDNVGFVTDRMRELWRQPERGTFPIAWSISPLLADLAPPILAYFGRSSTAADRFVAAPSGAGYLYPDYLRPGDLTPYLAFSRRYLEDTGLEVTWLLNAFATNEIRYSPEVLAAYADELRSRGLVLDYADGPRTADYWVVGSATPVIRATHLWTTKENFLAKVDTARAAWGSGPRFLWIAVYPYAYDLGDVRDVLATLSLRFDRPIEVVTVERFFALLEMDFVARARNQLETMAGDPIASTFLGSYVSSADQHVAYAEAAMTLGLAGEAAREASLAIDDLGAARAWESLGLAALAVVATFSLGRRRMRRLPAMGAELHAWQAPISVIAAMALFLLAVRTALDANFWTYHFVLLGAAAAVGLAAPLRGHLEQRYPRHALLAAISLQVVSVAFACVTTPAFPLAAMSTVCVITMVQARRPMRAETFVPSFTFGFLVGILLAVDAVTVGGLALVLMVSTTRLPEAPMGSDPPHRRGDRVAGLTLVLPLVALAPAMSYSLALRLELQRDVLLLATAFLLALGALLASILARRSSLDDRALRIGGFAFAATAALGLLAVRGTVATALVLLVLGSSLCLAAIATMRPHTGEGKGFSSPIRVAVGVTPLLLLVLRMPPVAYSLVSVDFPEFVEQAWYAPQIPVAAIAAAGAVLVLAMRGRGNEYAVQGDTSPEGTR